MTRTSVAVASRSSKGITLKALMQAWKRGEVQFPPIQRNYVWGKLQTNEEGTTTQSNFIHTMLTNYPTMPILVNVVKVEQDGKKQPKKIFRVLDGQQRTTTAIDFINCTTECKAGGFLLHEETPDVSYVDKEGEEKTFEVAGHWFKDLPEELQDQILSFNIDMIVMEDLTPEEEELIFKRFNSGMALTKIEKLRAEVGTKTTEFINELSATDFWSKTVGLSDAQHNRFVDFELLLQTAMVIKESKLVGANEYDSVKIGLDELSAWAMQFKETGLPQDVQDKLRLATMYLEEAFPEKENAYLKKSHIPMIVMASLDAIQNNINSNKFAGVIHKFHTVDKTQLYKDASGSKTADKVNVEARLNELMAYYNANINTFTGAYMTPQERKDAKKAQQQAKKEQDKIKRDSEKAKNVDEMAREEQESQSEAERLAEEERAKHEALSQFQTGEGAGTDSGEGEGEGEGVA